MLALDGITVEGFKSIKRIERLRLASINVLIGANGSGKSNFVGAFSFLRALRSGRLREYVSRSGGADRILHFGSKVTPELGVHVFFGGPEHYQYKIALVATETDMLSASREECIEVRDGKPLTMGSLGGHDPETWISKRDLLNLDGSIGRQVRTHLDGWRIYHFHDTGPMSPIKKTADIDDNRFLREDGANLAAFLHYLSRKHEQSYELIRRTVRLVASFFDDFVLKPQALNEDKIRFEWRHIGSDAYFNASSLSDGSLRFIALATLLLQPASLRPSVILLDEPELGLHPYAVTILASLVKQASVDTQIVLSTQSPLLLDHFHPDDVLVAERKNGATELRRLESEKLDAWLEDYSLGQLWQKNEFGGRPSREVASGERAE